jgi:hypothetical protein
MHSLEEVGQTADAVRSEIEQLFVRGLAASTAAERNKLTLLAEEWERLGASHVSSRLLAARAKADAGGKDAPRALLSAYTSLHVFERVLSLEAAAEFWSAHIDAEEEENTGREAGDQNPGRQAGADTPAAPSIEDPTGALALLDELSRAVEDLVRTGLASATESTRAKLDASFKEASRRKLLRLGATIRYVNEEVGRFLADDGTFSIRRFSFFLHRSWMLARGIAKGIREKSDRILGSLLLSGSGAPQPAASLEVVTLGVLKRTVANACTFDFKLRVVGATDRALVGRGLTFSLVFVRKEKVPAEAYLMLPQPQKFMPKIFRDGKTVKIQGAAVLFDERGGGRLLLGPKSTLAEGGVHSGWEPLFTFDPAAALERVRRHAPGPLDLAVEMQEEVVLSDLKLGAEPIRSGDGRRDYALTAAGGLVFDAAIADGPDGEKMLARLRAGIKPSKDKDKEQPLLYGLAYCEFGRMVLLPLSLLKKAGPDLITLSDEKLDKAALLKTLNIGG